MNKEERAADDPNPRNTKPISLHPLKPEDAIRAALTTPALPLEKRRKPRKVSKAR
jgi:hypothetical protein